MTEQTHTQLREFKEIIDESNFLNTYKRFSIETLPTPPRIKPPHPFIPKVSKIGLAIMLIHEVIKNNFKLLKGKEYRRALLSRPCIYGVFSRPVGGFYPIKEQCTGCMRCVLEYPSFCHVERNPEYTSFSDSYWVVKDPTRLSYSPVATINYEAETGKIPIKGMGYKGAFAEYGWDSLWTDMSEIVRPTRDGVHGREYISTVVDIGRKPNHLEFTGQKLTIKSKTISISLPIIFDYFPLSINSNSIQESIRSAARNINTFYIDGGLEFKDDNHPADPYMITLISPSELHKKSRLVSKSRVIEMTNFNLDFYNELRSLNPQAPLLARIPFKRGVEEETVRLVQEGVDGLHLYANYHGLEFEKNNPRFVKDLIKLVHSTLIKEGLRDEVTIIVSGGIILAEHVPKAIICGADLVAIDTAPLIALQCSFEGEFVTSETGRISKDKFSGSWGTQRLMNLLASWHDQLIEILSAMGMRDVRRLRGDTGRAMFNEDLEKEAFGNIDKRY